jgi:hypothetical protein
MQPDAMLDTMFEELFLSVIVQHDPSLTMQGESYSSRLLRWARTDKNRLLLSKLLLAIGSSSVAGGQLGCAGMWRNASTMIFEKASGRKYITTLDPVKAEIHVADISSVNPSPPPDPLPKPETIIPAAANFPTLLDQFISLA